MGKDGVIHFSSRIQEFAWLSNFFASPITINDVIWPTVEHYFQFPTSPSHQETIRRAKTPAESKRLGRSRVYRLRPDWKKVKEGIMKEALIAKYTQHEDLREKLLATGDLYLVERSDGDNYWGDGKKRNGQNRLGHLIGEVREMIKMQASGQLADDIEEDDKELDGHQDDAERDIAEAETESVASNNEEDTLEETELGNDRAKQHFQYAPPIQHIPQKHRVQESRRKNRNRRSVWKDELGESLFQMGDEGDTADLIGDGVAVPLSALPSKAKFVIKRNQFRRKWGPSEEAIAAMEREEEEEYDELEDEYAPPPAASNKISFAPTQDPDLTSNDNDLRQWMINECVGELPYLERCVQSCVSESTMMDLLDTIDRVNALRIS